MALLDVNGLDVAYGGAQALFGVGLEVDRGEVVALLGRNGAGKSTMLKCVMGLVRPLSGRITFDDHDITDLEAHAISRLGIGYVPEDRRIFTALNVAENLEVGRMARREGAPQWSVERVFSLFPGLAEIRDRRASRISGGEQQMLTVARTLMGNPSLLLLDEPSEGLAPRIVERMAETIAQLKGEGIAILLAEQNLRFTGQLADRAYVIETGGVRWQGPMAEFLADEAVQRAYLSV
ncbi:MAG: ABC transporter ATP-binding protein [Rhodospirillales bacterium]|jgi:branched-chain amino acid transport system ATP-binding protein|nr:ABC transporter ATP-binding protein [Rhodospirillales bacterium]